MTAFADKTSTAAPAVPSTPFRVSPEKTIVPDAPVAALDRSALVDRVDPAERRLTVFVGPGGFGKTTLLADCCRRAVGRGDRVLWLSADERDDAERVVAHLSYAADTPWTAGEAGVSPLRTTAMTHLDGLLAAIRADERRWILAVDEMERMAESGTRIIDYLIWRGPGNLHLALAGRGLPRSIDVATPIAEGRGISVGTDNLRFTLPEFASYFGNLPRERLRALWNETRGWPIAACLQRNLLEASKDEASEFSLHWVAARLMRGIAGSDGDFVLRAACFEWSDAGMLDEVLGVGSMARLRQLPMLRGLVQGIDGVASVRVHPLIGSYAQRELRLRGSHRDLYRGIARALARRGQTLEAVRHAVLAEDAALAIRIFESAGAVRIVFSSGAKGLQDCVALLSPGLRRDFPRVELACLAADAMKDPVVAATDRADRLLRVGAAGEDAFSGDDELQIDILIIRGILLMCGCAVTDSMEVQSAAEECERVLARRDLDPLLAGGLHYGIGIYRYLLGDLDDALSAARAARGFADVCPAMALAAMILEGAVLFAQGDGHRGETVLAQAQRIAKRDFAGHPSPDSIGNAFAAEAALEKGRIEAAARRVPAVAALNEAGAWLDAYAAVLDVRLELALRQGALDRALKLLAETEMFARAKRLPTFSRWLTAMHVSVLVRVGRVDEAELLWRGIGAPLRGTYVDREGETWREEGQTWREEGQTWREREAVYCARMRLLMARAEYDEALAVGRSFAAWARDKGLARSQSFATALALDAARRAGDAAAAEDFLVENLRLFRRTGFSRAMLDRGDAVVAVLRDFRTVDTDLAAAKDATLELLSSAGGSVGSRDGRRDGSRVSFSEREVDVLTRLDLPDKEIARILGLTPSGIRYHVQRILGKLGVANRREAMRKACLLGVLTPPAEGQYDEQP